MAIYKFNNPTNAEVTFESENDYITFIPNMIINDDLGDKVICDDTFTIKYSNYMNTSGKKLEWESKVISSEMVTVYNYKIPQSEDETTATVSLSLSDDGNNDIQLLLHRFKKETSGYELTVHITTNAETCDLKEYKFEVTGGTAFDTEDILNHLVFEPNYGIVGEITYDSDAKKVLGSVNVEETVGELIEYTITVFSYEDEDTFYVSQDSIRISSCEECTGVTCVYFDKGLDLGGDYDIYLQADQSAKIEIFVSMYVKCEINGKDTGQLLYCTTNGSIIERPKESDVPKSISSSITLNYSGIAEITSEGDCEAKRWDRYVYTTVPFVDSNGTRYSGVTTIKFWEAVPASKEHNTHDVFYQDSNNSIDEDKSEFTLTIYQGDREVTTCDNITFGIEIMNGSNQDYLNDIFDTNPQNSISGTVYYYNNGTSEKIEHVITLDRNIGVYNTTFEKLSSDTVLYSYFNEYQSNNTVYDFDATICKYANSSVTTSSEITVSKEETKFFIYDFSNSKFNGEESIEDGAVELFTSVCDDGENEHEGIYCYFNDVESETVLEDTILYVKTRYGTPTLGSDNDVTNPKEIKLSDDCSLSTNKLDTKVFVDGEDGGYDLSITDANGNDCEWCYLDVNSNQIVIDKNETNKTRNCTIKITLSDNIEKTKEITLSQTQ